MGKRGFFGLIFLFAVLFIPLVQASWYDFENALYNFFGWGYYSDQGFLLLKIGIFILLFTFLLKATQKMFAENKGAAVVVALVISVMAVAFIPADFIVSIGSVSGVIGAIIIIGALLVMPWMIIEALSLDDSLGKGAGYVYAVLVLAELYALSYLAQNVYYSNPALDYVLSFLTDLPWYVYVLVFFGIVLGVGWYHKRSNP